MAAAISPAMIIPSSCSQPSLFHSKRILRSSSVARDLSFPGSSVPLSHAIKVVAPGACKLISIQSKVRPPARYKRFRIIMDKPGGEGATKSQMSDFYIQTLAKVVGSKEEAKKSISNPSYEKPFGFECEVDEKTSKMLDGLPGVLKVQPIF